MQIIINGVDYPKNSEISFNAAFALKFLTKTKTKEQCK